MDTTTSIGNIADILILMSFLHQDKKINLIYCKPASYDFIDYNSNLGNVK